LGADVLAMLCALMPGAMVALAMKDVERQMREPMPLSQRPKRVAELEAELDRLGYIEERLIADGEHSPGAKPQHVLQVPLGGGAFMRQRPEPADAFPHRGR
jgi:hypothetical protein